MDFTGTRLRAARAALFTAVVVTLSTASHVLLSRVPLPLNTVVVIAAAVFALAYVLAGRERGFGAIAAALIPLELAADTVFTTGQQVCYGRAGGPVSGPLRSVGFDVLCGDGRHVGDPLTRVTGTGGDRLVTLLTHSGPATPWLLLGAHLCVGLVAAAWLHRGERALAQLLRAVTATTFRPLLLAVTAVTVRSAPAAPRMYRPVPRTTPLRDLLTAYSPGRRGPPGPAAVA
jgi:hypothetical protein